MDYYQTLGVEYHSDFAAIKKAYFRRAKECHPDLFGNSAVKEEEFKVLVAAFDVLSDPGRRLRYDELIGVTAAAGGRAPLAERMSRESIMDTVADDILEELIVGNEPSPMATLATLMLDLERTEVFMRFREGKNLMAERRYRQSLGLFKAATAHSPSNILYRCFLARNHALLGEWPRAGFHYRAAINIGERRHPPLRLERVRAELESMEKIRLPWWHAVKSLFVKSEGSKFIVDANEQMIEEANRAIAAITAERARKRKQLPR